MCISFEDLMQIERNDSNFKRLVEQMKTPLNIIPFVGAGMSCPTYPSWRGFLLSMAESAGRYKEINEMLDDGLFEEAAGDLIKDMGKRFFDDFMEDEFSTEKLQNASLNAAISLLPHLTHGPVITTNFDRVLEKVYSDAGMEFEEKAFGSHAGLINSALSQDSHYLVKLHGDIKESTSWIITLEQYENNYGENGVIDYTLLIPKILKRTFSGGRSLLFLGCSLNSDRTLLILKNIAQEYGEIAHYAIVEKVEAEFQKRQRFLSKHGIRPIWYPEGKHECIKTLLEHLPNYSKGLKPSSTKNLTRLPTKPQKLIGRRDSLDEIDKLGDRVLLINGLGGIGKTELCKEYFWEKYNDYAHVAWVDYSSGIKESIVSQVKIDIEFRDDENIDQRYEKIVSYLCNLESCLMIIDNINKIDDENIIDISRFPFRVIASSRINCGNFKPYFLDFMDAESCKQLFFEHYRKTITDEDRLYAEKVIKMSGYHTLTIELLAKQCKCSALTVKELYEVLVAQGLSLVGINERVKISVNNEIENLRLIEHLQKLFQVFNLDDENEKYILSNLSILPSLYISKKDIKEWLGLENLDGLNSLVDKGWIIEQDEQIRLHEVIIEVINNSDIKPDFIGCKVLIEYFVEFLQFNKIEKNLDRINYIVFGESILKRIKEYNIEVSFLANNIAVIYELIGKCKEAESLYKRALKISEQVFGDKHPDTAIILNDLARLYERQEKYQEAEPLYKSVLEITEQVFGDKHPNTVTMNINLARLYRSQGKYEEAELFYKRAFEISEQVLGLTHPNTITSINGLTTIYNRRLQNEN